jgi:hypothetical protein
MIILVDIDIRKPDTGNVTIDRPTSNISPQNTQTTATPEHMPSPPVGRPIYTEPVSEGEEDEDMATGVAVDEIGSARVPLTEALEAIAWRERELRNQEAEIAERISRKRQQASTSKLSDDENDERQPFLKQKKVPTIPETLQNLSIDPLAPAKIFDKSFQKQLEKPSSEEEPEEEAVTQPGQPGPSNDTVNYLRDFVASPGKRIAVPVRIEPKVFFAQERTFLVSYLSSIVQRIY